MKVQAQHSVGVPRKAAAFTLIEMVGVLAVIAILAALLIPRIFAAINESRLNNAVVSYNTVKSAAMMYFGKYGKFGDGSGAAYTSLPVTSWDQAVLLPQGLIEKPFVTRVAETNSVDLVAGSATAGDPGAFYLDGTNNATSSASVVVVAKLNNVPKEDAQELKRRIDGDHVVFGDTNNYSPFKETTDGKSTKGRVMYDVTGGAGPVFIYIGHK